MIKVNDVSVVHEGKENTRGKNPCKTQQCMKISQHKKKGPTSRLPWHVPFKKWMIDIYSKGEFVGHKRIEQREKIETTSPLLHEVMERWFF